MFSNFLRWGAEVFGEAVDGPAQTALPEQPHGEIVPPTIGLALGGGAARGWAHIGVVRTLIEAGYTIDLIAGTSMGAVVGGCHAAGKLDQLEAWARGLTRRRVFSMLDFSLGGAGMISGSRLQRLLEADLEKLQIEDLPIRFAAVATEITTGHEVWLTRGRLTDALRASYALPGVFEAVHVGGRWLMDGALVNPIPVSVARSLGARLVVAVNLNADMYGRGAVLPEHGSDLSDEQIPLSAAEGKPELERELRARMAGPPSIPTVMMEAFNITQDRIARARLAGDPPDITIGPKLRQIGLFEFHRAEEAIEAGAEATRRILPDLAEASLALSQSP